MLAQTSPISRAATTNITFVMRRFFCSGADKKHDESDQKNEREKFQKYIHVHNMGTVYRNINCGVCEC
ncbi:hypothetical protein JI58_02390 [Marinosulfonomonas sp. PRT-SC04]|nr:hypothetical protein JI58_02390 [Marinosulfonomonas sp. PRT-SC04]